MSTTVIDLLDALRAHLNDFDVPPVCSVELTTTAYSGEAQVSLQLAAPHLPGIADGLLAWADTLRQTTTEAWRVPRGDSVHLSVTGRLCGGVLIEVYGGLSFTEHGIGGDLTPGARKTVSLAVLRECANPGEVIL
ncbi:MAG: hypothetical protein JO272_03470 [Pseudonocardiales bacterium]|nr:hypothetical protein [Pseudonocardiales bacterium]